MSCIKCKQLNGLSPEWLAHQYETHGFPLELMGYYLKEERMKEVYNIIRKHNKTGSQVLFQERYGKK